MSNQLDSILGRALSIRLSLQISLSSIPIVEEWMDTHLDRWIESIPLPPEMPRGHTSHFGVVLAADLSEMSWRAYGDPAGFVPKLAKYFEECKMSSQDMGLIDAMGNSLEPELVGSWIQVVDGTMLTGWHFCDEHPFASIVPFFGEHPARRTLESWLNEAGIERFRRFSQSIGDHVHSELEFAVPGVAIDDQLAAVAKAFQILSGAPLPGYVTRAMSAASTPGFCVSVRIEHGNITRVSAISPGAGNDVIAQLCADAGRSFDSKLTKIQGALRAEAADRIEYCHVLSGDIKPQVLVHLIPSDAERTAPATEMN